MPFARVLHVDGLAAAVHPSGARYKTFAMLKSYWDESGIHNDSPICLIAGYFGGVNQWRKFERGWNQLLSEAGLKEFHAKHFWARDKDGNMVGPYKGWKQERASKLLDRLVEVTVGVDIYPVSCAVIREDFNQLTEDQRRYLTGAMFNRKTRHCATSGAPSQPYFLCLQWCVFHAAKYCKRNLKIHFAFDLNTNLYTYAREVWNQVKEFGIPWAKDCLGDLTFPRSEDAPGLQLADLLAFMTYRYAKKKVKHWNEEPNTVLQRLLTKGIDSLDFPILEKKGFAEIEKGLPNYLRNKT